MAKLSVVIPSRDERFLVPTIRDIFLHAKGEIEVVAVLDSDKWPDNWQQVANEFPNLHTIHNGKSRGMRHSINVGVASAKSRGAKFIMKSDGHCAFGEGFDEILKADCDKDWVVIPRRKRLEPETWTLQDVGKPDIDYHYLSYPDDPNDFGGPGLNGKVWTERIVQRLGKPEYDLDDELASQGSAYFLHLEYFEFLELMDEDSYGKFWSESQEVLNKCWLSGGRGVINKKTYYAHLHKSKKYGRGYHLPEAWLKQGRNYTMKWLTDSAWHKQTLPLRWLIEKFAPVPTWPSDLDKAFYEFHQAAKLQGVI